MHKSPDSFERDLERAIALENNRIAPRDPELAADWALKRELAGLGAAELPDPSRSRLRRRAPWSSAVHGCWASPLQSWAPWC